MCVRERERESERGGGKRDGEREKETARKARGKEERQGNKGMHADAEPISFTNMQMLLPL